MTSDIDQKLSVLIVDDDAVDREAIKRYLKQSGGNFDFLDADSGNLGLEMSQGKKFDCIFLDYLLPDMDGIFFLKKTYYPEIDITDSPVVMLTGQGDEHVMLQALRHGAQDYIIKDNLSSTTLKIAMLKARELFELKKNRKAMEEERQHARRIESIGQLTSGIAHDFNNLLTVILGNARILQSKMKDTDISPDLIKKAQAIELASTKGADLVRRLMVFARQTPLIPTVTDVNQKIREAIDLLSHSIGKSIKLHTRLDDNIPPALIDSAELQNAIINMCVNSRDAMPDGGVISIETSTMICNRETATCPPDIKPGTYILIRVIDTGIGMAPETMQKVFEPFYSTKPIGEGTGLGLSTTYGFVKQSNGHVTVQSTLGQGAIFTMFLPAHQKNEKKS